MCIFFKKKKKGSRRLFFLSFRPCFFQPHAPLAFTSHHKLHYGTRVILFPAHIHSHLNSTLNSISLSLSACGDTSTFFIIIIPSFWFAFTLQVCQNYAGLKTRLPEWMQWRTMFIFYLNQLWQAKSSPHRPGLALKVKFSFDNNILVYWLWKKAIPFHNLTSEKKKAQL